MKKHLILATALLLVSSYAIAASINANTNLASGKNAYGTFTNPELVIDGKIKGLNAKSGDTTDTPQYLTIDLGNTLYLERVKIYWDRNAYSNAFVVRTSSDAKYWQEEARNLDASMGVLDPASGTLAVSISLKRAVISSRYVQIMVPASSKVTNPNDRTVRIAEVQVYPAVDQKFVFGQASDYAVTDSSCIIKYVTSIGAASGTVNYGTDPAKLDKVAVNSESGISNSVTISGLKPKTTYFYQIQSKDFYGNTITSKIGSFATAGENVALKKKVVGTYTLYPKDDTYVTPGNENEILARVTDGKMSYFTSMATSGPVPASDQYVVIDLGGTYKVKNILSYWRKLAYPESLIVQVSDDNQNWTTIGDGVDAGSGVFARSEAGDPMVVLNVAGKACRYIKLLVKKDSPFFHKHNEWNFVQLMEVQAFAE